MTEDQSGIEWLDTEDDTGYISDFDPEVSPLPPDRSVEDGNLVDQSKDDDAPEDRDLDGPEPDGLDEADFQGDGTTDPDELLKLAQEGPQA